MDYIHSHIPFNEEKNMPELQII